MKTKLFCLACLMLISMQLATAATYHIVISGLTYSPSTLNAKVGDTITIDASSIHPLVQLDQATWTNNQNTPMTGGWGTKTANYTFQPTASGDIFYACSVHVGSGMKGKITVSAPTGLSETQASLRVSLFPNPSSGSSITVQVPADTKPELVIYNAMGQVVRSVSLRSGSQVVETDLANGIYFFSITDFNAVMERGKLVIER